MKKTLIAFFLLSYSYCSLSQILTQYNVKSKQDTVHQKVLKTVHFDNTKYEGKPYSAKIVKK